jgi:hypothetical protein
MMKIMDTKKMAGNKVMAFAKDESGGTALYENGNLVAFATKENRTGRMDLMNRWNEQDDFGV